MEIFVGLIPALECFVLSSRHLFVFIDVFRCLQLRTWYGLVLSDLELLPGVIPRFREHGRGGLRPLNHFC